MLALGAHLDGALELRFQLRAGRAGEGALLHDHVIHDGVFHGEHPVAEIWVRCEADAQTLCAIVLEITGLPENLHGAVAAVENFFTVLERNIPPALGVRLHGSQGKLHGSKRKIGLFYSNEKKVGPTNAGLIPARTASWVPRSF